MRCWLTEIRINEATLYNCSSTGPDYFFLDVLNYVNGSFLPFLQEFYGQAHVNRHIASQKAHAQEEFTNFIADALIVSHFWRIRVVNV